MCNFLSSIALDGVMLKNADAKVVKAGHELKKNATSTMNDHRDFTVGDIKESLHILANAYYLDEVRKKTSPHRLLGKQVTKIQNQRLRQFIAISREKADDIYVAIRGNLKKYDVRPEMGLFAIKVMVKGFLNQDSVSSKSFTSYVRQHAHDPEIQFFAQRWLAISYPMPSDERIQFSTEPWAKELDRLCEIVVKSNRRSTRLMKVDTDESGNGTPKLVLPSTTSKRQLVLPQGDKLVYSSLKSEDTEDSESFPSSPFQPKLSSSELVNPESVLATKASLPSQPSLGAILPNQPVSSYQTNALVYGYSESVSTGQTVLTPEKKANLQTTASPVNVINSKNRMSSELDEINIVHPSPQEDFFSISGGELSADIEKFTSSLGSKFRQQFSAASQSILSFGEAEKDSQQSEQEPLLNKIEEASNSTAESSTLEEKI